MPAAKATTTKKAPKKPADHKPKVETIRPEDTPGWELMRDMADIPVWDQMPLVDMLQKVFDSDEDKKSDEEIEAMSKEEWELYKEKLAAKDRNFDLKIVGDLALAIRPYAKDEDAFTKFASGSGAMQRVMNLVMAWVGQMGEFSSSAA